MRGDGLILASGSPRRRDLLAQVVVDFAVQPCPYPEPQRTSDKVAPAVWAEALAYFKARSVADVNRGVWVLGADTVVECGGELLGKPSDVDDARRMLELQARQVSEVITGVCLLRRGATGMARFQQWAGTRVWMRDDEREREAYLRSGDWEGKAGAYGIQTVGDRLVERIEGSFSNVVGLPLEVVGPLLKTVCQARSAGCDKVVP